MVQSCFRHLALSAIIVLVLDAPSYLKAETTTTKTIRQIEVPMPMGSALIYPTPAGRYIVCARRFPQAVEAKDGRIEACVRVAVLDLVSRKVISQEDLPLAEYRIGACDDYVLIADNAAKQVDIRSILDLSRRKVLPVTVTVDKFLIVPNKLICSAEGSLRIDYSTLQPSAKWECLVANGKHLPVFQYHDGWLIDGVLWDKSLDKPLLLLGFPHRRDFEFGMDAWEKLANGRTVSLDYPIAARLDSGTDPRVVIESLTGEVLGEVKLGHIERASGNSQDLTTQPASVESREKDIQFILMKNRLYIACNDKLTACDLSQLELEKLQVPPEIVRRQSHFTLPYGVPTKLRSECVGFVEYTMEMKADLGLAKRCDENEFELDIKSLVHSRPKQTDYQYVMNRQAQDVQTLLPKLIQRLGIVHEGLLIPERVRVTATAKDQVETDKPITLGYYVLSTIRADDHQRFLAHKAKQQQQNAERGKLAAERSEQERRAAAAARRQKAETEAFTRSLGQSFAPIALILLLLIVGAACAAPFYVTGVGLSPSGKMKLSYATGIIAMLPLSVCAFQMIRMANRLPSQPMPWVPIPPDLYLKCLVGAIVFMIAGFAMGILQVLQAKNYSWRWMPLLGLCGPVGYFVAFMLPKRELLGKVETRVESVRTTAETTG